MMRLVHGKLRRTYRFLVQANSVGIMPLIKLKFSPAGAEVPVHLQQNNVVLRSRTPDLSVAFSCFNGEFDILKYTLPKDYDGCIVDAGGYIGTAAIALHRLFPLATIICIEPAVDNLLVLRRNVAHIDKIVVLEGALTSKESETLTVYDRATGEWGYSVVADPLDADNPQVVGTTESVTLAEIAEKYGQIGLLKLDIEGGEKQLFERAGDEIHKIKVVFAELHDRIIDECKSVFFEFSQSRIIVKDKGDKYLSIKKQ